MLVIFAALYSSLALADDFKTIAGKEYKNVTVSRVEADVSKLPVAGVESTRKVLDPSLPANALMRRAYLNQ